MVLTFFQKIVIFVEKVQTFFLLLPIFGVKKDITIRQKALCPIRRNRKFCLFPISRFLATVSY